MQDDITSIKHERFTLQEKLKQEKEKKHLQWQLELEKKKYEGYAKENDNKNFIKNLYKHPYLIYLLNILIYKFNL